MVPVIVNAILGEHQLVVDIVAFVTKGDFPRSRLGEKQRGKILASWVTRKLRTIAQFSIRDSDGADSQITEVAEPTSGLESTVGIGSSLRNVETVATPPAKPTPNQDYTTLPTGISEMPATTYESSIIESPPLGYTEEDREDTPTESRQHNYDYPTSTLTDHIGHCGSTYLPNPSQFSTNEFEYPQASSSATPQDSRLSYTAYNPRRGKGLPPDPASFNFSPPSPPPPQAPYSSKPVLSSTHLYDPSSNNNVNHQRNPSSSEGDLWTLPSSQRQSSYGNLGNLSQQASHQSNDSRSNGNGPALSKLSNSTPRSEREEWPREAIMHMNLARDGNARTAGDRGGGVYDGSGYGQAL